MIEQIIKDLKREYKSIPIPRDLEANGWGDVLGRLDEKPEGVNHYRTWMLFAGIAGFFVIGTGLLASFSSNGDTLYPIKNTVKNLFESNIKSVDNITPSPVQIDQSVIQIPATNSAEMLKKAEDKSTENKGKNEDNRDNDNEDAEKVEDLDNKEKNEFKNESNDDSGSFKQIENENVKGVFTNNGKSENNDQNEEDNSGKNEDKKENENNGKRNNGHQEDD